MSPFVDVCAGTTGLAGAAPTGAGPAWLATSLPWIFVALFVVVSAGVLLVGLVLARLRPVEERLRALEGIDALRRAVDKIAEGGGELDLRRVEHVLIDLRDGQKRVEDRLLATLEGRHTLEGPEAGAPSAGGVELGDRIVTRLLALGYERVLLVTPHEDLEKLVRGDGEVVIEARRDGAICKGRVVVRGGRIEDLSIQPAYTAFP